MPTRSLFKCKYCVKSFKSRGDLNRHEAIHTGTRAFKCPHPRCTRAFTQKSGLKAHVNTHTGDKPHKCSVDDCPRTFGDPSSRTRHEKEAHNDQKYYCPHPGCHSSIKRLSSFRKHLERSHGIDPERVNPVHHLSASDATAQGSQMSKLCVKMETSSKYRTSPFSTRASASGSSPSGHFEHFASSMPTPAQDTPPEPTDGNTDRSQSALESCVYPPSVYFSAANQRDTYCNQLMDALPEIAVETLPYSLLSHGSQLAPGLFSSDYFPDASVFGRSTSTPATFMHGSYGQYLDADCSYLSPSPSMILSRDSSPLAQFSGSETSHSTSPYIDFSMGF